MRNTPPETGRKEAVGFLFCFVTMGTEIVHGYQDFGNLKSSFLILRCGCPSSIFNLTSSQVQPTLFLWWCLFQGLVCSCKLSGDSNFCHSLKSLTWPQCKVGSLVLQKHVLLGLFGKCAARWRGGGQSYWV